MTQTAQIISQVQASYGRPATGKYAGKYFVSATMLGDDATDSDAMIMASLLRQRGLLHVEFGEAINDEGSAPDSALWQECLDELDQIRLTKLDQEWDED